ncbi:MAG: thioredoxin-dependent thiol peroxidase [Bdellovibrionota bacterium]
MATKKKTKTPAKKAAPKKKVSAKKSAVKKAPVKKAPAKKAPAKKTKAKKVATTKAAPKKSVAAAPKKVVAKSAAPAKVKTPVATQVAAPVKNAASTQAAVPAKAKTPAAPKSAIAVGSQVPTLTLKDQGNHEIDLGEQLLNSPWTVLYFYPKDDTPGCTKQACSFRDHMNGLQQDDVQVLGVSPDSPEDHRKFIEKYGLNFTLLSDPERKLIEHFKLWGKKQFMGREYMGVERTTLLLKGDTVAHVWQPVSVEGHVEDVVKTLGTLRA